MKKNNQPALGQRISFDVFELLEAAGGLKGGGGHVVMPQEIASQIKAELERLYNVQETAVLLREYIVEHMPDLADDPGRSGLVSLLETIRREAVE
jgi:hypothetical protein